MEFTLIGILILGVALIAALVLGALSESFFGALWKALVVWVLFLGAWYRWGPPLPYSDWPSLSFAAVGWAIGLIVAASVALWLKGVFGGSRATS
jgi:hypothetical protein